MTLPLLAADTVKGDGGCEGAGAWAMAINNANFIVGVGLRAVVAGGVTTGYVAHAVRWSPK